jgi:hypothetical protein
VQVTESYKLHAEILGIILEDSKSRTTAKIPTGSMVTVTGGPLNGAKMVDVRWNEKTLMVFTQDLRDRAKLVTGETVLAR